MHASHKRPSQAAKVLEALKYGTLTSREAIDRFRITRLSGRIYELRKAGHSIVEVGTDQFGFSIFKLEDTPRRKFDTAHKAFPRLLRDIQKLGFDSTILDISPPGCPYEVGEKIPLPDGKRIEVLKAEKTADQPEDGTERWWIVFDKAR